MIVGSGLIAEAFKKDFKRYKNYIVYASGVSNSNENNEINFQREKELVFKTINENPHLKFIYFSSVLVDIIKNPYYNHKLEIEKLIKQEAKEYVIFRIPQVVGDSGNKNNLLNFITDAIKADKPVICYKYVDRSLLDVYDLTNIVSYCCDANNTTVFVSGIEKVPVWYIADEIGRILNKEPNIKYVESPYDNNWWIENTDIVQHAIKNFEIDTVNYTDNLIKKYVK